MLATKSSDSFRASFALLFLGLASTIACRADEPGNSKSPKNPGAQPESRQSPIKKEDLRYDGKDFEYWGAYLRTELKTSRRVEAIEAIKGFAANGYGKESAQAILDMVRTCKTDPTEMEKEMLHKARRVFRDIVQENEAMLVTALGDENRRVRSFAMEVAGCHLKSIPKAAVPDLIRAGIEGDEDDKWLAVHALAKVENIESLLKNELQDEKKSRKFVRALTEIIEKEEISGLALHFAPDDRAEIADALGRFGPLSKEAINCLSAALDDKSPELRRAAADALRKIREQK